MSIVVVAVVAVVVAGRVATEAIVLFRFLRLAFLDWHLATDGRF
jgi:hypothetical protein